MEAAQFVVEQPFELRVGGGFEREVEWRRGRHCIQGVKLGHPRVAQGVLSGDANIRVEGEELILAVTG